MQFFKTKVILQESWRLIIKSVLIVLIILFFSHSYIFATTWTGSVSTDWGNALNWIGGTPPGRATSTVDILIPTSPADGKYPTISTDTFSIKTLTIQAGATLTQTNGYLTLNSDLVINTGTPAGTYNQSGGTLQMKKA
jgi:hypothetical protein